MTKSNKQHQVTKLDSTKTAEGPALAEATRADSAASSLGEPVTPHAEITEGEEAQDGTATEIAVRSLLSCGVDSLDIGYHVTWNEHTWFSLCSRLDRGREQAGVNYGKDPIIFQDTGRGICTIYPTGKPPMYRYHLEVGEFHMYLSTACVPSNYGNVFVSINSRTLWECGLRESVHRVEELIKEFGGRIDKAVVSRADLCADFLLPDGLDANVLRKYSVPKNIFNSSIMQGTTLETFYMGAKKAAIRGRIYDKSKEAVKHDKNWFKDVWKVEKMENVWRVEFQFRRTALRQYGVDSVEDLIESLGGIWLDVTTNWFSLRMLDDSNTFRRTTFPWWEDVQNTASEFGEVVEKKRVLTRSGKANADWYLSRAGSLLVGYAACSGLLDLYEAVQAFAKALLGRRIQEYFDDAVQVKMVGLNVPQAETEEVDDDLQF